ncbi:hypothetical protein ACFWGL_17120 [Streptomyces sp. NPDC060286]|uniref:hypothetical protein n=1 Tax=unclassified Streptomyces TaxID=2593676 RepID=UPI0035DB5FAC
MGRLRLTRAALARTGVMTGGGLFTVGIGVGVGVAASLMTAGVLLVAYCLLLMDVTSGDGGGGDRT